MTKKLECTKCGGTSTHNNGYIILKDGTRNLRGYCRDCQKSFSVGADSK